MALFDRNRDDEQRLLRDHLTGEIAGANAMQRATGASEEPAAVAAATRERLAGELKAERFALEAAPSIYDAPLAKEYTEYATFTPDQMRELGMERTAHIQKQPTQPRQLTPEEQQDQHEARLAQAKRTELKGLKWMAERGLSGVTQEDVDKFIAGQGIELTPEEQKAQDAERARAGDPRKRAEAIRAEMAVKSAMTSSEAFRAMTDPESKEAQRVTAVRKAANVIAGGDEDISLSDLAQLKNMTSDSIGSSRSDLQRLTSQVDNAVQQGVDRVNMIYKRPPSELEKMISGIGDDLSEEIFRGLNPIAKAAAKRALVENEPKDIRAMRLQLTKERISRAEKRGEGAAERAVIMGEFSKTALGLNEPDFRSYLIDSGVAPADAQRFIDEALEEDSEGSKKHSEFIAEMRKKGRSVAYVTDDGVTVTTAKAPTAPKTLSVSGQTFQGKQLKTVESIAPTAYKILSALRDEEITFPTTGEPVVTDVGTGRSIANETFRLLEENKDLSASAAIRQVAEEYATEDQSVDQILGAVSAGINKRLTELSEERATSQFAAQREIADTAVDETFMKGTVVDVRDVEPETEAAMALMSGGNLSQDDLDQLADDRITRQLGDDAKFVSEEKRTAARERIEMAIERGITEAQSDIREAEVKNRVEQVRREGLVYENPDFELRFEGVGQEPVAFDRADPVEQQYLEAYDNARSPQARAAVMGELADHKKFVVSSHSRRDNMIDMIEKGEGWERAVYKKGETVFEDVPMMGTIINLNDPGLDAIDKSGMYQNMLDVVNSPRSGLTHEDRRTVAASLQTKIVENDKVVAEEIRVEREAAQMWLKQTEQSLKPSAIKKTEAGEPEFRGAIADEATDWVQHNITDPRSVTIVQRLVKGKAAGPELIALIGQQKGEQWDSIKKQLATQPIGE